MTNNLKKTCPRCNGVGRVNTGVIYVGVPGACFTCDGTGEVYKDKFHAEFGINQKFYGATQTTKHLSPQTQITESTNC